MKNVVYGQTLIREVSSNLCPGNFPGHPSTSQPGEEEKMRRFFVLFTIFFIVGLLAAIAYAQQKPVYGGFARHRPGG